LGAVSEDIIAMNHRRNGGQISLDNLHVSPRHTLPTQAASPVADRSLSVFQDWSGLSLGLIVLLLVLYVCMVYFCMKSVADDDTFSSYSHTMALMKSF
jgi:hypothetical protein